MILNAKRRSFDPTRTTLLRRRFVADARARIRVLQRDGITSPTAIRRIISGTERQWAQYSTTAYRKGVEEAWRLARRNLPPDEFGILQRDFLKQMAGTIAKQGRALAKRIQSEMEGVAQTTATRVARALADARAKELSKAATQQAIREALEYGYNAMVRVAHTELTRSYADGQLSAYEDLGMDYLEIEVEWKTSGLGVTEKGNPSPCPKCKPFEGRVFKLKKAKGMIPFHPFCMCRFVPVFRL